MAYGRRLSSLSPTGEFVTSRFGFSSISRDLGRHAARRPIISLRLPLLERQKILSPRMSVNPEGCASSLQRREFLKHGLTLAAAGLISAGMGGFIIDASRAPTSIRASTVALEDGTTTTLPAAPTSSGSSALLPDYQDFLNWLKSASDGLSKRSLSISMESEFAPIALQLRSRDFLQYGGIDDVYDLESYSQQLSAITLMTSTQSPSYDIFSIDNQNIAAFRDSVISPTLLAETYPDLTYPSLDLQEFSNFAWDNVALYPPDPSLGTPSTQSSVGTFPLDMPLLVLYCRADIYSRLGLSLPQTWDDYYEDVVTISKSGLVPFGVVNMASGTVSIVYEFMVHLASFGGRLWEIDGSTLAPTIDTDQALAALENYVRFQPYSDPGSPSYTWENVFDDLSRGVAATGLEWHDYYTWINQPSRSQVSGNIAVTLNPSGPSGSFSTFGGSGVGVSAYSKNPEAAWLWLQWATARGTQETLLLDQYHIYPSRETVLGVPDVSSGMTTDPAPYASTRLAQQIWASSGVTAIVGFPAWLQVLDILQHQLSEAWMGNTSPSAALAAAQQGVEALGSITF